MAVGTEFIIDQLKYIVLTESGTTGTVSVGQVNTNISGSIIIPESVVSGSVTYTVTTISSAGFKSNSKITNIYIPATLTNGVSPTNIRGLSNLRSINVSLDNPNFSSEDGVVYDKNKTYVIKYPQNKPDPIAYLPSTVYRVTSDSMEKCTFKYIISKSGNNYLGLQVEGTAFNSSNNLIRFTIDKKYNTHALIGRGSLYKCNNIKEISINTNQTDATHGQIAFNSCQNLRTVTIGNLVNNLSTSSFYNSLNIQTVNVDSQYVVDHFKDFFPQITSSTSPLRYVNIGDSVTSIGVDAFLSGSSLREVTLGKNVSITNLNSFYDCNNLKYISKNDNSYISYYSNGLTFRHAPLYELNVSNNNNRDLIFSTAYPKKLNIIGNQSNMTINYANTCRNIKLNCTYLLIISLNYNTILKSITIPKTVIQSDIKSNSALMSIVFEGNAPTTSSAYTGNYSTCKVYYYQDTIGWGSTFGGLNTQKVFRGEVTVGNYTYKFVDGINGTPNVSVRVANNIKLTANSAPPQTVTIEGLTYTVRYIADNGFENQYNLGSFDFHNQYLEIGKNAFKGCRNLTTVSNTNGITDIYESAFEGCSNLTSFSIQTITNVYHPIPKNCFKDCKKLQSITLSDWTYDIEESAFENCTSLQSINIPNECNHIYQNAFRNCTSLQSVTYGNNLYIIYDNAFQNCKKLQSFTIKTGSTNGLETLKNNVFQNCYSLIDISLDAIRDIGKYCFYNCKGLTSLTLPNTTDYVDDCAFGYCNNLTIFTNNTPNNAEFGNDVFVGTDITL